ncbi:hypothetical protein AHAS_Ahas07G0088800 [Arachis hypogaea]
MRETRANFKNQEASIRNLEVQVGQIAKQLTKKPTNSFSSDRIPNPRGEYNAINLRSGMVIGKEAIIRKEDEEPLEEEKRPAEDVHSPPPQILKEDAKEKAYTPRIPLLQILKRENKKQQYSML